MSLLIEDNAVVLFQGDSITDAGRNRESATDLGTGYALQAAAWFQALYPEKKVQFFNRGISGNRAVDLRARWQEDCIDLKPTWVSILIGINDTWRRYDSQTITELSVYEEAYRAILERTTRELQARLILCEPFVLPVPEDRVAWREDLDPRIHLVRQLACEYNALLVPFDGIFAQASTQREPAFWAYDGVHPSEAGHALMAQSWLRTIKAI
ncbi:SGNH/GDSL hydrolase family protein [Tengunoibacter tsumagoiensis]|uniref:Lipase n=1 Tax=Tengunoibacter tsumagoiensis TaxID=2014871 RepID=A0A401ZXL1_9CHLR|nr:SGNH/GDSL hydrolase family protein [Tengunoibacter tsumagoiensis]GCE11577.1 lipase [Tengunoibacter tsumagoiensis]